MARSLRVKWTLSVLGVAVVPMAAVAVVVLSIQRAGLSRAEKELETAVVDEAVAGVAAALDQAADVAARVSVVFADADVEPDARTRIIRDIVARAPALSGVAFFDEERRYVDAVVHKGAGDEALRQAPAGEGYRVVTLADGTKSPRFEARLAGPVRGFVVAALGADVLARRLRDTSLVRFGAPDRIRLVDESLERIDLGLDGEARGVPAIFASPEAARARSFATGMILTTELGEGAGRKVSTLRTMPAQRWAIVVERPYDEAFAALATARQAFLVSIGALVAVAILASLLVVRRSLGPISSLMQLVQRYGRREFSARSGVASGDELEALGTSLERMADGLSASEQELARRARIEENLRRYMPAEAAEAAASGTVALDLGGARRHVTVVFADVVAFTGFAERASPETAVAFLNELFTMLSEIVFRHDGIVDKFLGDCIMAVFKGDDHATRALAAAEDMHAFVDSNLPRWREAYAFTVELGIGVASGEVLLGNLGSSARMEYTVIGDAVNVAARLEGLARPRQTLTTRDVVDACPAMGFASLGEHALRGRARPVEVFEVLS